MTVLVLGVLAFTVQHSDSSDWHLITTREGLPDHDVRVVYEDRRGVMWFGTRHAGVARRDGDEWTYFTDADGLAANGVLDLLQTADNVTWAVGGRGFSWYDGDRWTSTQDVGSYTPNVVYDVFESTQSNVVWLGFNGGAARYDGINWTLVTPSDGLPHAVVHGVLDDDQGNVWFACRQGLARLAGDVLRVFYPAINFRSIVAGPNGEVWFGTSDSGVFVWQDGSWTNHLPGVGVHPVVFDNDGTLWAKTDDAGVYSYDGEEWRHFSTANGFPADTVHGIGVAADGTIWFATGIGAVWRSGR